MQNDIDLNLLQFFNTLYVMRSVTLTADHLGITQPAASQRLVRLRNLLHDPLFTRVPGGVKPTAVADQLAPFITSALDLIRQGLNEHQAFEPGQSQRCYRFHMSDMAEGRFLPQIIKGLQAIAPNIRLDCCAHDAVDIANLLHDGHLDFAIGSFPELEGLEQHALTQDTYVLVSRATADDEDDDRPVTLEEMGQLQYVSVRNDAPANAMLTDLELEDRIRQNTSNTMVMLQFIQQFDMHGVLASSVAESLLDTSKFRIRRLALPQTPLTVSLYWSQRYAHLRYLSWMKDQIVKTVH